MWILFCLHAQTSLQRSPDRNQGLELYLISFPFPPFRVQGHWATRQTLLAAQTKTNFSKIEHGIKFLSVLFGASWKLVLPTLELMKIFWQVILEKMCNTKTPPLNAMATQLHFVIVNCFLHMKTCCISNAPTGLFLSLNVIVWNSIFHLRILIVKIKNGRTVAFSVLFS